MWGGVLCGWRHGSVVRVARGVWGGLDLGVGMVAGCIGGCDLLWCGGGYVQVCCHGVHQFVEVIPVVVLWCE